MIEYFVLAAVVIGLSLVGYLVASFSTKETTYEEAIDERQKHFAPNLGNRSKNKKQKGTKLKRNEEPERSVSLASNIVKEALSNYQKPSQQNKSNYEHTKSKEVNHQLGQDEVENCSPRMKISSSEDVNQQLKTKGRKQPTQIQETKTESTKVYRSGTEQSLEDSSLQSSSKKNIGKKTQAAQVNANSGKFEKTVNQETNKEKNKQVKHVKNSNQETNIEQDKIGKLAKSSTPEMSQQQGKQVKHVKNANQKANQEADKQVKNVKSANQEASQEQVKHVKTANQKPNQEVDKQVKNVKRVSKEQIKPAKIATLKTNQEQVKNMNSSNQETNQEQDKQEKQNVQPQKENSSIPEDSSNTENDAALSNSALGKQSETTVKKTSHMGVHVKKTSGASKPKKIQIQEVSSQMEEQMREVAAQIEIANKDSKKKKSKEEKTVKSSPPVEDSVGELIAIIENTQLTGAEMQIMIETLLNRQQLTEPLLGEWVETGPVDPLTQLKKQIDEAENRLKDESEMKEGLSAKILDLRTELNNERMQNKSLKRQLEESGFTLKQKLESVAHFNMEQLNIKIKEVSTTLEQEFQTRLVQQKEARKTDFDLHQQKLLVVQNESDKQLQHTRSDLETQIQQTMVKIAEYDQRVNHLEAAYTESEKQRQAVVQSRDELAQTCQQYQQHLTSLKEQSSQKEATLARQVHDLQSNLKVSENSRTQALAQFSQVTGEREQLTQQINNLENIRELFTQNQTKLKNTLKDKTDLESRLTRSEAELSDIREVLKTQFVQMECLKEEKESLASQIVRPAADGQENGDCHPEIKQQIVDNHSSAIKYEENISALSKEVTRLKEDLGSQHIKNNEEKNTYDEDRRKTFALLLKLFPSLNIKSLECKDYSSFLEKVEENALHSLDKKPQVVVEVEKLVYDPKLQKQYDELNEKHSDLLEKVKHLETEKATLADKLTAIPPPAPNKEQDLQIAQLMEENHSLSKKVANYQEVLSNTESLLKSLQVSVETEETLWKDRLSENEAMVRQLTADKSNLTMKLSELQSTLDSKDKEAKDNLQLQAMQELLDNEKQEKLDLLTKLQNAELQLKSPTSAQSAGTNDSTSNGVDNHEVKTITTH